MKFNISTKKMKKLMNIVSKLHVKSSTRIYSSILMEVSNKKLKLSVHNNMEYIQVTEGEIEIYEEGKVLIDSKIFYDLIRNIDDVSLELQLFDDSILNIKSINSVYKINVLNLEFPEVLFNRDNMQLVSSGNDFVDLFKHILYSVDSSGINHIISGVNIKFEKDIVKTFSTDSFRLSNSFLKAKNNIDRDIIITKKSAKNIVSIIEENEVKDVSLKMIGESILVIMDDIYLSVGLIQGIYPRTADVDRFLNDNQVEVLVDRQRVENIVKRLMIFSSDESKSIIITVESDKILFENENNMFGNGVESIANKMEIKNPLKVLLSGQYLLDSLRNCSSQVKLLIESELNPVIVKDEKFKTSHLIIPLNA